MKKTLILALILLSLLPVYPKTAEITINNSIDFNSLIDKRAEGWFYHVKESYPVIPSQKFRIEEEGRVKITNVVLNAKEWSEISGATIVSGENSLPYEFNAGERSVVRDVKGQFPFEPYRVSVGYKDGKSVIYGYVSGYYYDNGRIYSRAGSLTIEYLVENPLKPMTESKSILVIAPDSLKSSWDGYRQFYPEYDVSILSVSDIISLTSPEDTFVKNIREYIKYMYENDNLKGVILGGDIDYIPGILISLVITPQLSESDQELITDKYYSCLDGDWNFDGDSLLGEMEDSIDIFPDVLLGRVPANNSLEVANFLSKVAGFRELQSDTFLGVASYLDAYTDGGINIDNMIKLIPITAPVKKLYESLSNLSSTTFKNALNKSPMFVTHDGHGNYYCIQTGTNYTYTSDLDYLTNAKPIFMYSLSCLSAAYDEDCIAEHFLKSTGGGYYLGNSRYGWYTPYFPGFGTGDIYNYRFYNYIFNETRNPVDALWRTFDEFSCEISEKTDWRWQFFTLNFFGDPMVDINLCGENDNLTIHGPVYKGGYLSLTVSVKDSAYVEMTQGASTTGKVLYPHDNLFFARTDSSDSALLRIKTPGVGDYDTVIHPLPSPSKIAYISSYDISERGGDTLSLLIELTADSLTSYAIRAEDVADTFDFLTGDSMFVLTQSPCTLEFSLRMVNTASNSSCLPVLVGGDTISLGFGRNIGESVSLCAMPDKNHYLNGETGELEVTLENPSSLKGIEVAFENDTVLIDTFSDFGRVNFKTGFTVSSSAAKVAKAICLRGYCQTLFRVLTLSANGDSSYNDFESGRDWEVSPGDASFHISTNRASSGLHSYYCGDSISMIYPPDYVTGIFSDSFSFDSSSFFGFDAFFDVESGFDYLVVYLYRDTLYVPVITLSGQSDSFREYTFSCRNYPMFFGQNAQMAFEFYSENDAVQYEGAYIDNVLLPGILLSMGTKDKPFITAGLSPKRIPHVFVIGNSILASGFEKNETYGIFDVSGRNVMQGRLEKANNVIKLNAPSGKYFFCAGKKKEYVKQLFILR